MSDDAVSKLKKKALEKSYKKDAKGYPKMEEEFAADFYEFLMEDWKPFPKDKVNRQIEKKQKASKADGVSVYSAEKARKQSHAMRAVSNFRTRVTDAHKATQKYKGKDRAVSNNRYQVHADARDKSLDKADKAAGKADKAEKKLNKSTDKVGKANDSGKEKQIKKAVNKARKAYAKWDKKDDKWRKHNSDAARHEQRRNSGESVRISAQKGSRSKDIRWSGVRGETGVEKRKTDLEKQAEHNKKDKEARATAKRMMNRAGLEKAFKKPAVKGATTGGFKEHMNFTEWQNSLTTPLYEVNDKPACPPGYKWDKKLMMCVPRSDKDNVGDNHKKDNKPENGPSYGVIGHTGVNGDGYAYAEPATGGD